MASFDNNTGPDKTIDLGGMNRKPIPSLYGDLPHSNIARNCLEALSIEAMGAPTTRGWLRKEALGTYDPNGGPKKKEEDLENG